ncbi:sigma-70 family RNA polymerase sigma factor [Actinomadura sp. NEAU-AAG5]|uniref:RNA polymerase sigma factor n=1 Tax=Actinomadura litoris TaxID=2678616 RepID=A0A7K1KU75_9ACTN|nr:sigma-70 family RNA polymerase sigma factor [Actinomadura litoris]
MSVNTGIDDQQLTRLALSARHGAPADVEAFTRAVYTDVRRFISYLDGTHGAEDLTQETFVHVLNSLPAFAGRSSARTWLLSIARRVVIDRYRSAARRPVVSDLADWQRAVERGQTAASPGWEEGVALTALLAEVPWERRAPFVLTQILGLSYAEAAEILGCPIGTIRSRVARARTQLIGTIRAAEQAI